MQRVVSRLNVAAFAVDDDLRVTAWNQLAEQGSRVATCDAVGKRCYDVLPAVDVETGRPCQEVCPLLPGAARLGWAHNRALRAPWGGGGRIRLQCFSVRTTLPGLETGNICLLEPPEDAAIERQARVLDLIEALYPAVVANMPPRDAVETSLSALLKVTGADSAELFLPTPDGSFEQVVKVEACRTRKTPSTILAEVASRLPDLPGDEPVLFIADYPRGGPGKPSGSWTLCAPVMSRGHLAAIVAVSCDRDGFEVADAARLMFPLTVHLAGLGEGFSIRPGQNSLSSDAPGGRPRLAVRCLGPLLLEVGGQDRPGTVFRRRRSLELLAFLVAHRGRPVSREVLMETFWPDEDPRQAGLNLRVVLHELRRAIEPERPPATGRGDLTSSFVRNAGEFIVLDPSDRVWVDAEAFLAHARTAGRLERQGDDAGALAAGLEAHALYRGEFLEGETYGSWAVVCREQFRETHAGVTMQTSRLLERQGRRDEAIDTVRRSLRLESAREEFHRELMRLFAAAGRHDEAVRQYHACRRILAEELEAVPSAETEGIMRDVTIG